jgi:hypothetical protein
MSNCKAIGTPITPKSDFKKPLTTRKLTNKILISTSKLFAI